jgi:predicted metalloendopeptidase
MDQVEEHLHKADWLDSTTRTAAISKLQNTSYIIGGPEEMYYAEQFDKDFGAGNVIRVVEKKGWILSWAVTLEIYARRRSDKPVKICK